jgi:hypothetical protein
VSGCGSTTTLATVFASSVEAKRLSFWSRAGKQTQSHDIAMATKLARDL